MLSAFITIGLSFLLGSIPTGFLVGKYRGLDIRTQGSGNIGATNAFRILGKGWGSCVLIVDVAKGWLASAWIPIWIEAWTGQSHVSLSIVAGLAVVCGHNFSPWLRFRGGKGIATTAGVLLGLMPSALGIALLMWLLVFLISRYVSLASVIAALALPVSVWFTQYSFSMTCFAAAMGGMAIFRHKNNIERLLEGTENRFEWKNKNIGNA